ncbi:MAG: hypothetical protein M5R36_24945 [Deltaproteobacteria bacterium]|nr:hypothetical protein [Deltaproteobacteria bacterium]
MKIPVAAAIDAKRTGSFARAAETHVGVQHAAARNHPSGRVQTARASATASA